MKKISPEISYNLHALSVLEFEQVRKIVASHADSEEGRSGISGIIPCKDAETARALLAEVEEIMQALSFDDPLPGMSMQNIRDLFPRLNVKESNLEIEEISTIADILELGKDVRQYFERKSEKYPLASSITDEIEPHGEIVTQIRQAITPDLEIADDASPELRSIRRKLQRTRSALRKAVEKKLAELSDEVVSERIVTIRDGRYVLPVRDSMKKYVPGSVHDRSQTGKTFFIEPLDAIEGNNQVRELELAEHVEIMRILANLTQQIASVAGDIEHNQDVLVRMDMITAKARFGVKVEGVIPKIQDEPVISIVKGRHPLLDWKYREKGESTGVIPLNIEIGRGVRTMVITGPNAGGKTVALKTLGLITMMALSGMPVTAAAGTTVFAPPDFFADIGDEQSIENDLSTFSSHMKHIVTVLREAGPETLVLLDELGGGTNPSDGEAIALAVLRKLTGVGALTLATSHHDGLKVYAHETEGIVNASMEFDNENHRPAFILKTGVPGSSYAFEIAARMGMPGDVLAQAESLAGGEKKSLEGLILEMEELSRNAEHELKIAASERVEMEAARKKYEEKLEEITASKEDMLSEALAESQNIVEDTNRRIESTIKTLREKKATHDAIIEAKSYIEEMIPVLKEKAACISPKKKKGKKKPVSKLKKGMIVWVESLGNHAEVEEVMSGGTKARIRVGKSKATIIIDKKDLSACEVQQKKRRQTVVVNVPASKATSQEIKLRGMTFDEARDALDTFLDSFNTSGFETAHIIHGKGTGTLRRKIWRYLEKHNSVESWRLGNWNEGSFGVTVVTMKK